MSKNKNVQHVNEHVKPEDNSIQNSTDVKDETTVENVADSSNEAPATGVDEKKATAPDTKTRPMATENNADGKNTKNVTVDNEFKVGTAVMLKDSVSFTITGVAIPQFAHKNRYKISKILSNRVIITAGYYTLAVSKDDIVVVK